MIYAPAAFRFPPYITGCAAADTAKFKTRAYWVPVVVFESTVFVLAFAKAVAAVLQRRTSGDPPRLLIILLRDSIVYFGGLLAVVLANLLVWSFGGVRLFMQSVMNGS